MTEDYWSETEKDIKKRACKISTNIGLIEMERFKTDKAAHDKQMQAIKEANLRETEENATLVNYWRDGFHSKLKEMQAIKASYAEEFPEQAKKIFDSVSNTKTNKPLWAQNIPGRTHINWDEKETSQNHSNKKEAIE